MSLNCYGRHRRGGFILTRSDYAPTGGKKKHSGTIPAAYYEITDFNVPICGLSQFVDDNVEMGVVRIGLVKVHSAASMAFLESNSSGEE